MTNKQTLKLKQNDEPDCGDALGHYELVERLGQRLLACKPPYVIGICGSWGAGKTSFLKKLWAYFGGDIEWEDGKSKSLDEAKVRSEWFAEDSKNFKARLAGREVKLIWFNPWQHQFEASPLVALLHEIRNNLNLSDKVLQKAGKAAKLASLALLDSLPKLALEIGAEGGAKFTAESQLPTAKSVRELKREYENDNFSAALSSQRFRDYFEAAIEGVVGEKGLLIIFIDDLDRCEGTVSYRLLEALKLYLNARNCVYVLGIDPQHLESSIARALLEEKETWRHRALARDYLSKMLQMTFLLPTPRRTEGYIQALLDYDDGRFHKRLIELFTFDLGPKPVDFKHGDWPRLVKALDENLPHNPRKLKSFVASWKTFLDVLPDPKTGEAPLDWRLTLVLQYLAQFEEPLYRRIEHFPSFYLNELLRFCQNGTHLHPLFYGLEIPPRRTFSRALDLLRGGLGADSPASPTDDEKKQPEPRFFWIAPLIVQLFDEYKSSSVKFDGELILRHLPRTVR